MARTAKLALVLIYILSAIALLFGHCLIIWCLIDLLKSHKFIAFGGLTFLFLFFILFEIYVVSTELDNWRNRK